MIRINNVPQFFLNNGFFAAAAPAEAPPSYVPQYVQFYRNPAATSPYADVSQLPAAGSPPDACGGYVVTNLPNNRVSLIHVPQVPTFPNYTSATASTLRTNADDVQYFSLIQYGVNRQVYTFGDRNPVQALRNSELGNQEIAQNSDGSATFVVYPTSATLDQVHRSRRSRRRTTGTSSTEGSRPRAIPLNSLMIREKGQNSTWANALSREHRHPGRAVPAVNRPQPAVQPGPGIGASDPDQRHGPIDAQRRELHDPVLRDRKVPKGARQAVQEVQLAVERGQRVPERPGHTLCHLVYLTARTAFRSSAKVGRLASDRLPNGPPLTRGGPRARVD